MAFVRGDVDQAQIVVEEQTHYSGSWRAAATLIERLFQTLGVGSDEDPEHPINPG